MLRKFFFAASAAMILASTAAAATITYTLDKSVPGTFSLYAQTSAGDNGGLAVYGVPLLGQVLTLDNFSPYLQFGSKGSFFGPSGFSGVRSADVAGGALNPVISGSQDTVNAAAPANLVFGVGQTDGSFVGAGFNPIAPGTEGAQAWLAKTLLATGTYSGSLAFDTANVNLVGNAFAAAGGAAAPAATIQTVVVDNVVPEPATLSLLGLAMVGGFGVIRRRRVA